jgi:hypothetical protein
VIQERKKKPEDNSMTQQHEEITQRLAAAYDIDFNDLALDKNAVASWMKMLEESGHEPRECLEKARAKYDPETKDLYLTVPVEDEEAGTRVLTFVLQDEYWEVDTHGAIFH